MSTEAEKIQLACGGCGTGLRVAANAAGKRIRCPKCQHTIAVQQSGAPHEKDDFELKIMGVDDDPPTQPPMQSGGMEVFCHQCAATLRVPPHSVGKTIHCPKCQYQNRIIAPDVNLYETLSDEEGITAAPMPEPELPKPEKIQVDCACGTKLRVAATTIGKRVRCPKCQKTVRVEDPGMDDFGLRIHDENGASPAPGPMMPPGPAAGLDIPRHLRRQSKEDLRTFGERLATAFLWPVSNFIGISFIVTFSLLWGLSSIFGGILLKIALFGYIAAFMFNVMRTTAMNRGDGPSYGESIDFVDMFLNCFRFAFAGFIAAAPFIGILLIGGFGLGLGAGLLEGDASLLAGGGVVWGIGLLLAAVFGVFYYPMTLMLIGFRESLFAPLNFYEGIRAILRIPGPYLITALYFVGIILGAIGLQHYIYSFTDENSISSHMVASIPITVVSLYLWMMQFHVLGNLYATNKEKLGWFR